MMIVSLAFYLLVISEVQANDVFACIPRDKSASSKDAVEQLEQSQGTKLTDKDILTRLVFAETLNTNYFLNEKCESQGPIIAKAIAWGAMNRVRMSNNSNWNSARKTAFAAHQFAPAISHLSIFADLFTCPNLLQQDSSRMNEKMKEQRNRFENYSKKIGRDIIYSKYVPLTFKYAKAAAEEAFHSGPDKNPFIMAQTPSPVLNFYYPLSDDVKYGNPDWNRCNKPLDNVDIDGVRLNPDCIRFFHAQQIARTRCVATDGDKAVISPKKVSKAKKAGKAKPKIKN